MKNRSNLKFTARQLETLKRRRPAIELRMMLYGNAFYDFNEDDTDIIFRENPSNLRPGISRVLLEHDYPLADVSVTGTV